MTGNLQPQHGGPSAGERFSAVVDGEADDETLDRTCAAWREDVGLRSEWHLYHLIGDAMRSEDLCGRPGRDSAFLRGLRARLDDEPNILAPAVLPATVVRRAARARWRLWSGPVAAAAGFFAVAGVLWTVQEPGDMSESVQIAGAPNPSRPASALMPVTDRPAGASTDLPLVTDAKVLRDARVDRYLSAHRELGGGAALGPFGFTASYVRNGTTAADGTSR